MKGLGVNLDSDGIDNNKHPLDDLFSKAIFTAKRRSFKSPFVMVNYQVDSKVYKQY